MAGIGPKIATVFHRFLRSGVIGLVVREKAALCVSSPDAAVILIE